MFNVMIRKLTSKLVTPSAAKPEVLEKKHLPP